jgi:transposase-like protein
MGVYSTERKAAVIARMLPPHNQSVNQIARQEGIPPKTLYHWRSSAGIAESALFTRENSPREWSQEEQFAVLIETAPLSAHAVAEYCRRKDLYPEQLQQWKDRFMQPRPREEKAEIK